MTDRNKVIGLLQETAEYFRECRSNNSLASKAENHFWELQNAANEAVELIKGHEPKTVILKNLSAYCPWCSTETIREMGVQKLHLGTHFCPYCGQKVKWE